MDSAARERFAAVVTAREEVIDLAEAALLIAADEYDAERGEPMPASEVDDYLRRYLRELDALGAAAGDRMDAVVAAHRAEALIEFLAGECGFRGNQDDYYDRRNSYLNDVLDRRLGIPITLAVVYIEVGRRVGLDIQGVGFPGHFLALHKSADREEPTIIDPFFGIALDEEGCTDRLRAVAGPEASFDPSLLSVATTTQILIRMLANLKMIHLRSKNLERALACCDRTLLVVPDLATELRDRAALYLGLECFDAARRDLERFLEIAPHHESAELVHGELVKLRADGPALH